MDPTIIVGLAVGRSSTIGKFENLVLENSNTGGNGAVERWVLCTIGWVAVVVLEGNKVASIRGSPGTYDPSNAACQGKRPKLEKEVAELVPACDCSG